MAQLNNRALAVLSEVFGYPAFRGHQAEVIGHLAGGGDALVLMPTGSGKSLCYQIPALLRDGVGVVVSPLIALMQDQVAALAELGVRAAFLNSTLSAPQAAEVESRVRRGELDLLYVAPERLLTPRCLELLAASRLALLAIDEAHCVSQWGHDFRPEYLQLSVLQERFPAVPRIALTATADAQTRAEILQRLELGEAFGAKAVVVPGLLDDVFLSQHGLLPRHGFFGCGLRMTERGTLVGMTVARFVSMGWPAPWDAGFPPAWE